MEVKLTSEEWLKTCVEVPQSDPGSSVRQPTTTCYYSLKKFRHLWPLRASALMCTYANIIDIKKGNVFKLVDILMMSKKTVTLDRSPITHESSVQIYSRNAFV